MQATSVYIDGSQCDGCGLCVRVCPARAFTLEEGRAVVAGECSLACEHCAAVCPRQAIEVDIEPAESLLCESFAAAGRVEPVSPPALFALLRHRRSCRVYREKEVPLPLLKDLVRAGITAPSGTNSQAWSFTVIPNREKLLDFGSAIAVFYEQLNRLAEKGWLRRGLRFCRRPELENYYREYYESVREGLESWRRGSDDRLFHGARAAILVGSRPGASCPVEDALLAAGQIILVAESLGLGSCLIGFAVEALARDKKIKRQLGIPAEEKIHAVIALGWPAIKYQRPTARRRIPLRVVY